MYSIFGWAVRKKEEFALFVGAGRPFFDDIADSKRIIAVELAGSLSILGGMSDMFLLVGTCPNQKRAPERWAKAQKICMMTLITLVGGIPVLGRP